MVVKHEEHRYSVQLLWVFLECVHKEQRIHCLEGKNEES